MKIKQYLEEIRKDQLEILRLLQPAVDPVVIAPVRNSARVADMFARSAKNEERRRQRDELRQ